MAASVNTQNTFFYRTPPVAASVNTQAFEVGDFLNIQRISEIKSFDLHKWKERNFPAEAKD